MSSIQEEVAQAQGAVYGHLSGPLFYEKCAAYGHVPNSESEAAEMWSIASKLHRLYSSAQEKVAAEQVSNLTAQSRQLDDVLAAAGLIEPVEKVANYADAGRYAATTSPVIAHSILTLQAAAALAAQSDN